MKYEIGLYFQKQSAEFWTPNIESDKFRAKVDILPSASRQIINHPHAMPHRNQRIHNMRPDKPRPAGDNNRIRHITINHLLQAKSDPRSEEHTSELQSQ